ncbi:rhamnan synthesis F family protein [Erwinia billingiae]|uniref:rhamnan synthesis F family protein n=1 Tax=Erwinia billingiae TaxID=182337 RepID=UPI0022450823|nr:rhamnan synthesis F family protein [Erwinia billingiae]MCX0500955.1 hypothetical protein [Erwinia billingiae]
MKGLVSYFYRFFLKVVMFSYYGLLSYRDSKKTKKFENVIHEKEFIGGKVMLLALYEKTSLRNDTLELLKEAKKQNVFIIAVNTLKLSSEYHVPDLIDIYVERDNFGRDFGSYQAGMKLFFAKKIAEKCERLLIINDSVFFSKKGLANFIEQLFNTSVEVLGATENKEISHHLGSFCISVDGKISRNPKFESYWKNYKSSNVRPLVIKRGEFTLSRVLKSLVSSENHFRALYDVNSFEASLNNDEYLFKNYYNFRREGARVYWTNQYLIKYFEDDFILKSFYNNYIQDKKYKERAIRKNSIDTDSSVDFVGFANFLYNVDFNTIPHGNVLRTRLLAIYLDDFTRGSQIHNNCLSLHHLGLPIIKLDLLYRSVCNFNDLIKLKSQLDSSQQEEFMMLMTNRLSGEKFLFGLNRKAFDCGIL